MYDITLISGSGPPFIFHVEGLGLRDPKVFVNRYHWILGVCLNFKQKIVSTKCMLVISRGERCGVGIWGWFGFERTGFGGGVR